MAALNQYNLQNAGHWTMEYSSLFILTEMKTYRHVGGDELF